MNPNGSIPKSCKASLVKKMALHITKMIDFLQYNKIYTDEGDSENGDALAFDNSPGLPNKLME